MSCKYLAHWKLPNSNFYPSSMISAVHNEQQSTTVMVANAEQVVSISVKNIERAKNDVKVFVRCELELDEAIRELKWTGTNVLLISSDGQLMVYDGVDEKFHKIDSFNQILHAQQGPEKGQLFVVRQACNGNIVLEVIDLSEGVSSHVTIKSYDLVIESIVPTAQFSIKLWIVNEANEQFLGNFLGFSKLSAGDQVLLIAVNNSLYWLQEQGNAHSDLIAMRLCLTVLLQAGVLVIFSQSLAPDALLVSTSSVFLHAPIEAYAFDKLNNGFLYSNGLSTHRVQFHYSEAAKQITTESKEVPVRGVIEIAVFEGESKALLLTENNQFYLIECVESKQTSTAKDIVAQNNPHPVRTQDEQRTITYCIRNEQSKTKAASFSSALEIKGNDMWFTLDAPVGVRWHGERVALCAKTDSPIAMDLVKRFLLDNEEYLAEIEQRRDKLKGLFIELQAVTDASLIIIIYRKLRNNDIVEEDVQSSPELQS
uniref:Uncharacterized protein n=1 Tax=Anopheles christyi TaxID=43041 RepID=A0A182JTS7_9DIPT